MRFAGANAKKGSAAFLQIPPEILAPAHGALQRLSAADTQHFIRAGRMIFGCGKNVALLEGEPETMFACRSFRPVKDAALQRSKVAVVLRAQRQPHFGVRRSGAERFLAHLYADHGAKYHTAVLFRRGQVRQPVQQITDGRGGGDPIFRVGRMGRRPCKAQGQTA